MAARDVGDARARLRPVLAFGVLGFLGSAVLDATSVGLVVGYLGADALPSTFIVGALLLVALGVPLARIRDPGRALTALRLLLAGTATGTILLGVGMVLAPAPWLAFLSQVWWWLSSAAVPMGLWAAARRRFDIGESKRFLGAVGTTFPVGNIVGYTIVPLLIPFLGASWMLVVAGVPLAAATLLFPWASESGRPEVPAPVEATPPLGVLAALRQPMVRPLLVFVGLNAAGTVLLSFNLMSVGSQQFPSADDAATLLAVVLLVSSVLAALVGALVTSRALRRYGVGTTLALQAAVVGTSTVAVAVLASAGAGLGPLLVAVVVARLLENTLRPLSEAGSRLLARALPPDRREVASTLIEGVATPAAILVASLLLLVVQGAGLVGLLGVLTYVATVVVALAIRRGYPPLVREALAARTLDVDDVVLDADAVAAVRRTVSGGSAAAITYGLDLLEQGAPDELDDLLPELLGHPDERVRLDALRRIERLERLDLLPLISARLPYEGATSVRAASLGTIGALRGADAVDELAPALRGAVPLRAGAVAGLLRSGDVEAVLAAGEPLLGLLRSADPAQRRAAASVLADSRLPGLYRPLAGLLDDPDHAVARTALHAAGAVRHPRLWPAVVAAVSRPEVRPAALRALAAGGADALPAVAAVLEAGPAPEVAVPLLGSCPHLGPQAPALAVGVLPWAFDSPDRRVGDAAVRALLAMGVRCTGRDADLVLERISRDLDTVAQLVADAPPPEDPLGAACLRLRRRVARGAVARWAVLQDPASASRVLAVLDGPAGADAEQLSYASEAIETGWGPRGLLREVAVAASATAATGSGSASASTVAEAATADAELRSGLAARVPAVDGAGLERLFATGLRDDVVLAGLVLHAAAGAAPELLDTVGAGAPPLLATTAALLREDRGAGPAEGRPMTPIERILALRACVVFADADDDALAHLAEQLTDRPVQPGERLFAEGDAPTTVFLVLDGLVSVAREGRERHLAAGELVGEAAAAAQAPHAATAVVREAGVVLAVPAPALEELLADSPAVSRELLRRLALQARSAQSGMAATDEAMASILDRIAGPPV